jgi:hypothetical protein
MVVPLVFQISVDGDPKLAAVLSMEKISAWLSLVQTRNRIPALHFMQRNTVPSQILRCSKNRRIPQKPDRFSRDSRFPPPPD